MKVYWKFEIVNNLKFTLGSIRTIDQVSHNSIVQFCKHWEESFTVTLGTIKKIVKSMPKYKGESWKNQLILWTKKQMYFSVSKRTLDPILSEMNEYYSLSFETFKILCWFLHIFLFCLSAKSANHWHLHFPFWH